jgi:hypothetical protein
MKELWTAQVHLLTPPAALRSKNSPNKLNKQRASPTDASSEPWTTSHPGPSFYQWMILL